MLVEEVVLVGSDLVADVLSRVRVWPEDLCRPDVQALMSGMSRYERGVLFVALLNRYG